MCADGGCIVVSGTATVGGKFVDFLFTRQVEVQSDNRASFRVDLTLVRAFVQQAGRPDGVQHVHAKGDVFEKVHPLSFHLRFGYADMQSGFTLLPPLPEPAPASIQRCIVCARISQAEWQEGLFEEY